MKVLGRLRNETEGKIEVVIEPWVDVYIMDPEGQLELFSDSQSVDIEFSVRKDGIVVFLTGAKDYESSGSGFEQM